MTATRVRQIVNAPRPAVWRALVDPRAVARWMVPDGMSCLVHAFEPREGGRLRISLTYEAPTGAGKTTAHTDTYHGTFVKLVPDEQLVEVVEFETANAALQGEMTIAYTLADADGATEVLAVHDRLPPGLSPEYNELGWRMSLGKLARLVEGEAEVASVLDAVTRWAVARPDVRAVALVGSRARGAARAGSDVDLVLVAERPVVLDGDPAWWSFLGPVRFVRRRTWGPVIEHRVALPSGLEVELNLAPLAWAGLPLDPGTARVLSDGARALHDPDGLLAAALEPRR